MDLKKEKLNLYQEWASINKLAQHINNNDIENVSALEGLSPYIKVFKILFTLDSIGISILNSFCSKSHPEHIDKFYRVTWITSFTGNILKFHETFQKLICFISGSTINTNNLPKISNTEICDEIYLFSDEFLAPSFLNLKKEFQESLLDSYSKHLSVIFPNKSDIEFEALLKEVITSLHDRNLITDILEHSEDKKLSKKYEHIEPFFKGVHQITEIVLDLLIDYTKDIRANIRTLDIYLQVNDYFIKEGQSEKIDYLRNLMLMISDCWHLLTNHIYQLSLMDTGSYANYRQTILGTSGAESVRLRTLHKKILTICDDLPFSLSNRESLVNALSHKPKDKNLNYLLTSIRLLQAATADFWLRHFSLVMNTIGFVKGSQGLPVSKLLGYATDTMISEHSLVNIIGHVGNYYANFPEAYEVEIEGKTRIVGKNIYHYIRKNYPSNSLYEPNIKTKYEYILDCFDLRDLEPADSSISPYSKWFDLEKTIDLQTHSFGKTLNIFAESTQKTAERLAKLGNNYWEIFFSERLNQFKEILLKILKIEDGNYKTNIDSNVSTIIERLISAIKTKECTILTSSQEFIAQKRIFQSKKLNDFWHIIEVNIDPDDLDIAAKIVEKYKSSPDIGLVFFSQIMSNMQISLSTSEIKFIISQIDTEVPIIIDITQGFCNVSINWGDIIGDHQNVYLVGSCVKYARSTNGLGFLVFPKNGILNKPSLTGWCSYISGLAMSKITDEHGALLYDEDLKWFGGTPANHFSIELFINSWDAILRKKETVESMNQYVQTLHKYLISGLSDDIKIVGFKRRKTFPAFNSSCIVLEAPEDRVDRIMENAKKQNIFFDQRKNLFLRIGAGIHNSKDDMEKLIGLLG